MNNLKTLLLTASLILSAVAIVPAQNVNDPAPDFTLNTLSNSSFTLSEQKGKVVFIFFFGWNCYHCKANGPNTQSDIYDVFKANTDFVAIGVETWNGTASGTQNFVNITGIEYPVLLKGSNTLNTYKTTYDRIVVVDQQGIIKYKSSDVANKTTTSEASDVISSLLDQTTVINNILQDEFQLQITPNPVNNQLTFKMPDATKEVIQLFIYNLQGQTVLHTQLLSNVQNSINVANLLPGYYSIKLVSETGVYTDKFLKER